MIEIEKLISALLDLRQPQTLRNLLFRQINIITILWPSHFTLDDLEVVEMCLTFNLFTKLLVQEAVFNVFISTAGSLAVSLLFDFSVPVGLHLFFFIGFLLVLVISEQLPHHFRVKNVSNFSGVKCCLLFWLRC